MARISQLPDILINQIAAGEVVERPASVVKELVENALDAGARSVAVRLVAGGRELVEVSDDGSGMDADDAPLALERHATSKISSAADLEAISTLGFRGEALPSIAAASRLLLETAAADGEGTRVEVEFGRRTDLRPCARPRGTTVEVRDLFLRLPARHKFLRTAATELRHATSAVTSLAFVNPGVTFSLAHGGRTLLELPAVADPGGRLPDLAGPGRAREARPFEHAAGPVRVSGFLVPTRSARQVILAANGRVVRDRVLIGSINRALAAEPSMDVYLHVVLPAHEVDVNVHPTKAEVRFHEPGRVIGAVTAALASALRTMHGPVPVRRVVTVPTPGGAPPPSLPLRHRPAPAPPPRTAEGPPPRDERTTPWGRYLGQYRNTYLLLEDADGLVLVDQHVAHERVLVERLLDRGVGDEGGRQTLLVPQIVEVSPELAVLAGDVVDELAHIGLELEPMSGAALRVTAVPAFIRPADTSRYVSQLLADLDAGQAPGSTTRERAAASLACQAAIKKNRPLTRAEAEHLLDQLAATREPHRCPHGRPILLRLPHDEIERRIGRR